MEEKRIAHIITGLGLGGAERMLCEILGKQVDSEFKPSVISLSGEGGYGERIRALGVPVYGMKMQPRVPDPLAILRLRRLIRKGDPLVVHAWMYHAGLAAMLSAQGRPVVLAVRHALHDWEGESRQTRLVIRILARASRRAARIVYNSEVSRLQHEQLGYVKRGATVIPNGFDCTALCPRPEVRVRVRQALGVPPDAVVIGHVGRFHPVKDHGLLLSAFATIAYQRPDIFLLMAGSRVDAANKDLMGRVKALDLGKRVRLLGERDDIPDLISAFDVLVNCSRSEAFPNVLGEAMACGVPCIATDTGDSSRVIGDTGIIVPPRDPEALAVAIRLFTEMDPRERARLGARARERIERKFGLSAVAAAYSDLYHEVIDERKSLMKQHGSAFWKGRD